MTPEAQGAVERAAATLCDADTSWEHHDQTDDHPCARCRYYAQTLLDAGYSLATPPTASHDETALRAVGAMADKWAATWGWTPPMVELRHLLAARAAAGDADLAGES